MRILLSCVPYDGGKSGISVCMREQVAALKAAGHSPTLIVEHDAAGDFPDDRKILLPAWTRRPLFSMLYHLFILPFRIRRRDFDFCLICAANRRALAFYPLPTIAVVHDLSQYHVTAKYDAFRMFYIRHVLPFFVRRAAVAAAISHSTAADLQTFWKIIDPIHLRHSSDIMVWQKVYIYYTHFAYCCQAFLRNSGNIFSIPLVFLLFMQLLRDAFCIFKPLFCPQKIPRSRIPDRICHGGSPLMTDDSGALIPPFCRSHPFPSWISWILPTS